MENKSENVGTKLDKILQAINTQWAHRSLLPFTGGLFFVAYAFFWPESYGHWLGSIVRAFRNAAGL